MEIEIKIKIVCLNRPDDVDSEIQELKENIKYGFSDMTGYEIYDIEIEHN